MRKTLNNNNSIKKLSNDELFAFCKKEEQPIYFSELYRRYIPMIYGVCLKYLANEADAQDAVMDIFEDVSKKISMYEINNFHTWLYSVVKNHCFMFLRKTKQSFSVNLDEQFMENEVEMTLLDEDKTYEEEQALAFCMDELSEEQRKSIEYFYYENKSYADIVVITGYTLQKVKSYIQNGKRNLKNCIVRILNLQ